MTDDLIMRIDFPGGYIRVSVDYLIKRMPMHDLDGIIKLAQKQDPVYEERLLLDLDCIIDEMMHHAFDLEDLGPRRFWQLVTRIQRLGVCRRWTAQTVIDMYTEHKEDNNND